MTTLQSNSGLAATEICVWRENKYDHEPECWIVSRDVNYADGKNMTTETLDVTDTRAEAIRAARRHGQKLKLPVTITEPR